MNEDMQRWAERDGIALGNNPYFPVNTITLMRILAGLQGDERFEAVTDTLFAGMWLHGRNMADPEVLAATLTERHGVIVEIRAVDLADPPQRESLADELAGRDISILCANAGTATFGPVADLDPAAEKAQVQLNVLGVHDLVLAVLPGMIARRAGGILISGSAAGNSPIPNNATYAASKAFANTFSESLRGELRDTGVHVTLLAPGPVRAEMPDASEASLVDKLIPDFLWISVEHTAVLSLDGLERNKMRVVPGVTSKAMSVASGYAPRAIVTPIVGAVYKKLGGD
jgi:short-subunit dehydrogenase